MLFNMPSSSKSKYGLKYISRNCEGQIVIEVEITEAVIIDEVVLNTSTHLQLIRQLSAGLTSELSSA